MHRPRVNLRAALALLLAAALMAVTSAFGDAGQNLKKIHKVAGIVTEIDSLRIKIDSGGDSAVAIHTPEDYTERVLAGMQVTAWYYDEGSTPTLERLDYPLDFSFVPPTEFVPRIQRAILLPSSNAGDAEALIGAIERLCQSRLRWVMAHRMLAEEIRRRATKTGGEREAPSARQGEMTPGALAPADPELVRRIASATRADAVLEVRIEHVLLKVTSHTAEWDGAREKFGSTSSRIASAMTMRPLRGQVPAATVVLKLHDPHGRLLWRNRRGFRVLALQTGMGNNLRNRSLAEATDDTAFLDAWLNDVFASLLAVHHNSSDTAAQR